MLKSIQVLIVVGHVGAVNAQSVLTLGLEVLPVGASIMARVAEKRLTPNAVRFCPFSRPHSPFLFIFAGLFHTAKRCDADDIGGTVRFRQRYRTYWVCQLAQAC